MRNGGDVQTLKNYLGKMLDMTMRYVRLIGDFKVKFAEFSPLDSSSCVRQSRRTFLLNDIEMITERIFQLCLLAGIEVISKHHFQTLKHSIAIHLAEKELDISKAQHWLGHKYSNYAYVYYRLTHNNG